MLHAQAKAIYQAEPAVAKALASPAKALKAVPEAEVALKINDKRIMVRDGGMGGWVKCAYL